MFRIPMGAGEWYVGGDIRYEGSKFAQVHNLAQTGSRTVVGAQAGYRTDRWEVTVWGKNLTDDDTAMDILRYIDTQAFVSRPGPPCAVISPAFNPAANCGGFLPGPAPILVRAPSFREALVSPCHVDDRLRHTAIQLLIA